MRKRATKGGTSMRLYEIDANLRALWTKIAEQDGEITEEDMQALNELELAKNDKLEGYGVIIREMKSEIDECDAEIKRIKDIADKKKNAMERLKKALQDFMISNEIDKYESVKVKLSFRKSQSLEIEEGAILPDILMRIKREPDKTAIKEFIINGGELQGVNRNVGEINKANGKADTGYAGDTSIDAYNAYRNSVNKSYSDANSANNELYSYYLTKMTELQQAKDNKEATDRQLEQTDRQLDMQEQQYQDEKETNVVSEVSGMLAEDGAFNTDGSITNETAQKTWDYITRIYGENVPESTMAYLESQEGFSEWLEAYNSGADGENSALNDYIDKHENPVLSMETQEGYRGADNTYGKVNIQGFGSTDRQNNDIDVSIGGTEYDLRMGNPAKKEYSDILDNLLAKQGKSKSPKTTAVYDGHLFIVDHGGTWRQMMSDNSNINDAVSAYIKVASGK
ncbi:MAG: siphovirus Gp157 family protein [Clostridiales bacterium]|nr:siphovirus Gp157 family protein [Clostridiales bacterium]